MPRSIPVSIASGAHRLWTKGQVTVVKCGYSVVNTQVDLSSQRCFIKALIKSDRALAFSTKEGVCVCFKYYGINHLNWMFLNSCHWYALKSRVEGICFYLILSDMYRFHIFICILLNLYPQEIRISIAFMVAVGIESLLGDKNVEVLSVIFCVLGFVKVFEIFLTKAFRYYL